MSNDIWEKELYDVADYALERLKEKGANGATIEVSSGQMDELNVDAGRFSLLRTTFSSRVGLRALSKSRKGVYVTNKIDLESVGEAVDIAMDAAEFSEPDSAEVISEGIGEHTFDLAPSDSKPVIIYERMAEFLEQVKQEYSKIKIMQFIVSHNRFNTLYANSNGTRVLTKGSQYDVMTDFSAMDGEQTTSFNGMGYVVKELDLPILSLPSLRRLLEGSQQELNAKPVEGKFTGTLLCTPSSLEYFLGSTLANCTSSSALVSGTSPWIDKIDKNVSDSRLNVSYAPLDAGIVNGSRLQDGYLSYNQDIIKEGKLEAFALNEYAALKTDLPRAGSGENMVVAPGDSSVDELISSIDCGILINRFSGGSMSVSGDFSGIAKNSFLIKNGKISGAVNETMVSGNILEMLFKIVGISKERDCDGISKIPWIAFDGVVISGK